MTTKTNADAVLSRMRPCPESQGIGRGLLDGETHVPFCKGGCKGSGEVPVFPALWKECDDEECNQGRTGGVGRDATGLRKLPITWVDDLYDCECCGGRGIVYAPTLATVMEALLAIRTIQIMHLLDRPYAVNISGIEFIYGDTLLEAAKVALAASGGGG